MDIYNARQDYVQVSLYNATDTWYWKTAFYARLSPNQHITWDAGSRQSIKVFFNVEGNWVGPQICKTTAVTLDEHKNILNSPPRPALVQDFIHHIVVLMMENRSFDNILGWLYADSGNKPPRNFPSSDTPTYDGLLPNKFWNTDSPAAHDDPNARRVYASRGLTQEPWYKQPHPNPREEYPSFLEQMFGTEEPAKDASAKMNGFLASYGKADSSNKDRIMQCFSPEQLPVISQLAKSYSVCDRWFSSIPCETLPNRSFLHAGTSFGRLNNGDKLYEEKDPIPNFGFFSAAGANKTIFDILTAHHIPWEIYQDSFAAPSLTASQFWVQELPLHLNYPFLCPHAVAGSLASFEVKAAKGELPSYSFIEPEFMLGANDQHPGPLCDMRRGEKLIHRVWNAVRNGPKWNNTLLIITYDEHGGCYDHVSPPATAVPPDNFPLQFKAPQFKVGAVDPMRQLGVRVPTLVISPYIEAGTVFRTQPDSPEYDHTSILATVRDWLFRPGAGYDTPPSDWIKSNRVAKAPTLWNLLTLKSPRTDKPNIALAGLAGVPMNRADEHLGQPALAPEPPEPIHGPADITSANSLQLGLVVEMEAARLVQEKAAIQPNVPPDERTQQELREQAVAHVLSALHGPPLPPPNERNK